MAASSGAEAGSAAAAGGRSGPVSFAFSRKAERRRGGAAGPGGGGGDTDFLTAVEGRELLSTRPAPPPPQELVIPLLPSPRRWPRPRADGGHAPSASPAPSADHAPGTGSAPSSVEAQAVEELLREARQSQQGAAGDPGLPISIPLQDRDGAPRPQPGPQDYEAVPVAAFGLAVLRGMGWSQGEGIGRTFKRVVKPLEHRLRPRGLGLGAEVPPPNGPPNPPRGGGGEGGGLAVGDSVRVEAGPHRGMDGKVEGLDPETARAVVRLALGGQAVTVSQHSLRPGTPPGTGPPSRNRKGEGPEEGPDVGGAPQRGGGKRKEPPGMERAPKQLRALLQLQDGGGGHGHPGHLRLPHGRGAAGGGPAGSHVGNRHPAGRSRPRHGGAGRARREGGPHPGAGAGAEPGAGAAGAGRGRAGGAAGLRRRLPLRGGARG
ncbi:G-patch domain and KOW motifs-containing protein isoform X2 [Nyctibius grandis]|uniref:G-patch domain and KOW motifs-containing protein isoform X2 n=1 Tax=Nyctibius grandis TaxID=48427 RepID=UPI0035BC0FB7